MEWNYQQEKENTMKSTIKKYLLKNYILITLIFDRLFYVGVRNEPEIQRWVFSISSSWLED